MDKIIVTSLGITLIALIYWFFFGRKEEAMEASNTWNIAVDGGYKPNVVKVKQGVPATLTFTRTDPNSCLEEIVMPDFKIKKFLPMNEAVIITFTPTKVGAFGMHCGMNMFHGRIEVV